MSRFKMSNELLTCDKEEYMKLVHLLNKYGYLNISDKNEMLQLEQLKDLVPIIEDLRKKYSCK